MTFCALSSGLSVGSGMTGVTVCAQSATAQASAIESLSCTLFFHPIPLCDRFLSGRKH
jgi:hypothetical protein